MRGELEHVKMETRGAGGLRTLPHPCGELQLCREEPGTCTNVEQHQGDDRDGMMG